MLAKCLGKAGGKIARGHADPLGQLERDGGGVVAVLRAARTLDARTLGEQGGVQAAVVKDGARGSQDGGGKVCGSH
jgi:hypothetical protein